MSTSGTSRTDRRNSDDMHRQSSRTTTYADDVVVAVDTNDLLDNDVISSDHRSHRRSESSRRDHPTKRSYESSSSSQHRSSRHSPPPTVSHKRHHSSQRVSSPPPSSSRHQRSSRPSSTLKRSHSRSRSPHERPTHRSRPQHVEENSSTKKPLPPPPPPPPPNESADLSTISEDEATKPTEQRSTRSKVRPTTESSSTPISHKITPNETSFDTSQVAADHDLSLFPNSILSVTSSLPPPPPPPTTTTTSNDLLQAIDLLGKYKTMQSIPSVDPQILACEKEILQIIQKKIDLQKKETQINERAMKLRERELAEREKQLEPAVTTVLIEEKVPPVEPMEKEENALETKNENLSDDSTRPTRKSRFSAPSVEPAASSESDERTPTSHLGATTSESQPSMSLIDAELKVISTNSCRKVEISGATTEKKNTSDDLRHTISKNRSKQVENGDHPQSNESNGSRLISDDEQKITISQIIPPKNDDKAANFDFHSQRSFTSSDNTDEHSPHDKRRSQPRTNRRQQSFSNDRSNFSTSQSSRYGSNAKRYENEDLRSHLHETKTSRSSRTNYRNNH